MHAGEGPRVEEVTQAALGAAGAPACADAAAASPPGPTQPGGAEHRGAERGAAGAAPDELPAGAEAVLAALSAQDRETVLGELRGLPPDEQARRLAQVEAMLASAGADVAERGGDSSVPDAELPTEEELAEAWAQIFEDLSDEDRKMISEALQGKSLRERFEFLLEVEEQLASHGVGAEHQPAEPEGGARRRGAGREDAHEDDADLDPLPFEQLRARWAAVFDCLCASDRQRLLATIDDEDAHGQTSLLLAVEARIREPDFVPGASILHDDDDDGGGGDDADADDESVQMSEVWDTIYSMGPHELHSEFDACFNLLLERTQPSAAADEDAARLRDEWEHSDLAGRKELLFQLIFYLNKHARSPVDDEEDEAAAGADAAADAERCGAGRAGATAGSPAAAPLASGGSGGAGRPGVGRANAPPRDARIGDSASMRQRAAAHGRRDAGSGAAGAGPVRGAGTAPGKRTRVGGSGARRGVLGLVVGVVLAVVAALFVLRGRGARLGASVDSDGPAGFGPDPGFFADEEDA